MLIAEASCGFTGQACTVQSHIQNPLPASPGSPDAWRMTREAVTNTHRPGSEVFCTHEKAPFRHICTDGLCLPSALHAMSCLGTYPCTIPGLRAKYVAADLFRHPYLLLCIFCHMSSTKSCAMSSWQPSADVNFSSQTSTNEAVHHLFFHMHHLHQLQGLSSIGPAPPHSLPVRTLSDQITLM